MAKKKYVNNLDTLQTDLAYLKRHPRIFKAEIKECEEKINLMRDRLNGIRRDADGKITRNGKLLPHWMIYIPEEGHWDIGWYADEAEARAAYLKWANRKRLPPGAKIVLL